MPLLESLEKRRFLTVTVNQGSPGYYEIVGDSSANQIAVSVSQNNYTFVLDNITYFDVMYIAIDGAGGNDTISVTSFDGEGYIAAAIQGGAGNDTLTLAIPGGVWGGDGDDQITLTDSYRGEVYGEAGNDTIYLNGTSIDAEIRGGSGDDVIDCSNSDIGHFIYGGDGNDTLIGSAYADQIYGEDGADLLVGGGGDDTFHTDSNDTIGSSGGGEGMMMTSSNNSAATQSEPIGPLDVRDWLMQLGTRLRIG